MEVNVGREREELAAKKALLVVLEEEEQMQVQMDASNPSNDEASGTMASNPSSGGI